MSDHAGDVLVLRALGLGDALTALPALRGMRRAWPDRRLVLAGRPDIGRWLEQHGVVDAVVEPRGGLADALSWVGDSFRGHVAVNLHGRGPQSHRALLATGPSRLVAFACPEAGTPGPRWDPDEHEVDRWRRLVASAGGRSEPQDLRLEPSGPRRGHVVVHPGAASASRRWPPDRYAAVAQHLLASGRRVVVTGSAGERSLAEQVARPTGRPGGPRAESTAGLLDLRELADLVASADLVVSGDTGVAHLATALGTPSVVLFGPTPPRLWGPSIDPELHTVLWHGAEPGHAGRRGDPHGTVLDAALAAISVDEVLAAVENLLDARPSAPRRPTAPRRPSSPRRRDPVGP